MHQQNDLKRLKGQENDRKMTENYTLAYENLKTPVMTGTEICRAGCNRVILRNSAETVKLGGKSLCYNGTCRLPSSWEVCTFCTIIMQNVLPLLTKSSTESRGGVYVQLQSRLQEKQYGNIPHSA